MQLTQPPTRLGGMDARAEGPVVLVIDDQPAILDMLAWTLAHQGYQPVCIANGQEALEWIKNTLLRIRDLYERLRLVVSPDSFDAGE